MTADEQKDQNLERDIINAVKARGLQESMNRWAKTAPKQQHRLKVIDIILISVAASVLVLIVVNVAIKVFRPKNAPEVQTEYHCKTETKDSIIPQDTAIDAPAKTEQTRSVPEKQPSTPVIDDKATKVIAKITLPEISLSRYSSLRYWNAPKKDDPKELLHQAEIHWNAHDYARSEQYSQRVIDELGQSEYLSRSEKETLRYAEIYHILAITYLENPNFSENTIQELERLSQEDYLDGEQVKAVLDSVRNSNVVEE